MNVDSKLSIASNNYPYGSWWRSYMHSSVQKPGNPGIICIVCLQVISHPSEDDPSFMVNQLLANSHIGKSNKLGNLKVYESTK
jgi:hypothetical protein